MSLMNEEVVLDDAFQQSLLSLVLESVSPWIEEKSCYTQIENWRILQITSHTEQMLVTIKQVSGGQQYTALMCCLSAPEVVAVSQTDGMLEVLNPYLDGGRKIETELDAPGNWNILSISFKAQKGATALRFLRGCAIFEIEVNQFGCFEIVDWNSNQPVEEYLEVLVDGVWQQTVVRSLPFSVDYLVSCWKKAANGRMMASNRWNKWITATFVELGGHDRAVLQDALMNAFCSMSDDYYLRTFKQERRKFLKSEQSPLSAILQVA